jgi:hypothetical protein
LTLLIEALIMPRMSHNGFVDVVTRPAGSHSLSVPNLGTFAPGAGPTIGSDGTVVVGTLEGRVIALHPDGSPFWNRILPSDEKIASSPAIGRDQSVYVVTTKSATVRDHRHGSSGEAVGVYFATLYNFTVGGGAPVGNRTEFPEMRQGPTRGMYGPRFVGAPSMWQNGAEEVVMVPAVYYTIGGYELHILAFGPNGGTPKDVIVAEWNGGDVTGSSGIDLFPFAHGELTGPARPPLPGLGIMPAPGATEPFILITNKFQNQIVGYRFDIQGSQAFTEIFRTPHSPHVLWSAPTILSDGHAAVGTDRGVVFSQPNTMPVPPITGIRASAAPSVAADGRGVIATIDHSVIGIRDHAVVSQLALSGASAVPVVASRTHVYVSTTHGLHTLDATAQVDELRFPWVDGGTSPPAVGPNGQVYAITSNVLLVFPPPPRVPRRDGVSDVVERVG